MARNVLNACRQLGFATIGNQVLWLEFIVLKDLEAELEIQLWEVIHSVFLELPGTGCPGALSLESSQPN